MLLELVSSVLVAALVSLVGHVLIVAARNRQAYKFFEKNAPDLPVLPNPSLFGGHSNQLCYAKYNWKIGEKYFNELGSTYGFYVDCRPAVATCDLDFVKAFIVDEPVHNNRMHLNLPIKELEDDCIMFAEDDQWLRLRRAIAPAFSAYRIKSANVQADINSVIGKFAAMLEHRLGNSGSVELDTEDISQRFALALVFTNFYKQNDVIDFFAGEDKYVKLTDRYFRVMVSLPVKICAAFPILRTPMNWLVLNFHEQGKFRNTIMNYIKQQTRNNFAAMREQGDRTGVSKVSGSESDQSAENIGLRDGSRFRRNMIDYVTDQYREGKLTRAEYFNSVYFLFSAADKTSSDAVSRMMYNLARHPEVQEKLRRSIHESGTDSEYLSWAIHETLRLHPPAPIACSRRIKRDFLTKNGLVPAGTAVVTPARTIHRLREYWGEDADDFRPERWADAKNFHPCQYLAFGAGRRACPGKELALMEIRMLFNCLLRKYKFELSQLHPEDNSDRYDAPLFAFLIFDSPTYVRLSRLPQTK